MGHGWYVVSHDNEKAEEIMKGDEPGHVHLYDQEVVSDEALKSESDCEDAAVYYLSCTCGKVSKNKNETFTYGDPLGHEEANSWKKTARNTGKSARSAVRRSKIPEKSMKMMTETTSATSAVMI